MPHDRPRTAELDPVGVLLRHTLELFQRDDLLGDLGYRVRHEGPPPFMGRYEFFGRSQPPVSSRRLRA